MHMMNDPQQQQQFCLRWNNHGSTLVAVFESLFTNESLVDVTLFTEGHLLRAHKVVLSACSTYFETLFSQTCHKHPIVILKDVKHDHLKALLEYMYKGEVNISQDQLAPLIKTAESLKIKGLADGSKEDGEFKNSIPYPVPPPPPQPRATKPNDHPIKVSPSPSLDIKPRIPPPVPFVSTQNSVLSTALTMPTALSMNAPLNLPPLSSLSTLPHPLASSIASSLTNSIPISSPFVHDRPSRTSECGSPRVKKRRKHRRHSGEGTESPDSDCPSSGSPGDSTPSLHLPRIPATITPINHPPHHIDEPQQHPKDLSSHSSFNSHSHNNHHENDHTQRLPPHLNTPYHPPPVAQSAPPAPPPAAHAPPSIPLLLPTSQHNIISKIQEYPEDLKQHTSKHPLHCESQQNSHHLLSSYSLLPKPSSHPHSSRDVEDERSPSPSFERNCSSGSSRRDEDQRADLPKGSPPCKIGSDPESSSTTKGSLPPGKAEDTSSDNHYSEDDCDDTSNERCAERASDYSMGPSTSRPHSEEAPVNQNYLSWPVYPPETSNAEEGSLTENANQDYLRAINLVRAGISGLLPTPIHSDLLSRPSTIAGLPLLLKGNKEFRDRKSLLNYSFPETPKQFSCEKCGRTYASTGNLKRHKKYECGVEPQFACPICKKKFQHRHSVKIHVYSTHRNESNEGGPGDSAGPAGLFATTEGVSTVATAHLRDEYFPIPQEASSTPRPSQDS